jgi:DNA-binding SARP family transcriptional activator
MAGAFAVVCDGDELAPGEVGSRKARTLLKLLAVERPGLVTADRIAEVLWNGAPPVAADRNIATLISRLRAVLGSGVIHGGRDGYRLGTGTNVSVDLDTAARLCEQAERKLATGPAVALAAAERASDLLSADMAFTDEPYASWADPARMELRQLLRRARLAAAEAALATADSELAARYAESAIAADGLDEAAHRLYMAATAAAGEKAKALLAYAGLRERLAAELGTDPASQTRALHVAILREDRAEREHLAGGRARGLAAAPASAAPRGPALTGRADEIRTLRAAWGKAVGREPGLVMIVGAAGIGKTALAEFLAADAAADGATVLSARCYETERSLFLQPIVEALTPVVTRMSGGSLRDLLGPQAAAAAALLPEVADLLGPPPPGHGSMEMERRRAFEAMTALLRGLAGRNPVMLTIDDLQCAGQSTVEFLHFAGRHVAGHRLLIVVTVRAEQAAEISAALGPVATGVEVGPLASEAVEQLARDAGQGALAADILRRTRGHTLFVVEVLRALGAGDTGVPESLRSAIQARVRQAGASVEALLRAAAVVGAAVDPLTLGAMLNLAPAAAVELCERALLGRLLAVSGREYEFANDLIREVLYATTPEPTRLAYHRHAADLFTSQPEALARHAAACADWPRAARAWLLASEAAMRRFAASDAIALASSALDAAARGHDAEVIVRAQIARGRAREAAGALADALSDFTEGAARARAVGDRRQEMHALRDLGGDVPVALGLPITFCESNLVAGLQIAVSLADRATEAALLSRLAVIATNRLKFDPALDLGLRAVAAARAAEDEQALAIGLDGLKTAYFCLGNAQGMSNVLAELDPLLRRLGDLFRLQWAEFESAFLAFATADWDAADARIQTAIETNHRSGYPAWTAWYVAHLGMLARLRGRDEDAVALGRRALALAGRHEHTWFQAAARAMLSPALLRTGEVASATQLLESGLAAAEQDGAEAYVLRCLAPLAAVTGSAELLTRASGLLERATSRDGAWIPGYEVYLSVAQAWLGQREPERARSVLRPLLAVAERAPWKPVLAESLIVDASALAALRQDERARSALRRAVRLADKHGMTRARDDAQSALATLR